MAETGMIALIKTGGWVMYPLILFSVVVWVIFLERAWAYYRVSQSMKVFGALATQALLQSDLEALKRLSAQHLATPTAALMDVALQRFQAKESRVRDTWQASVERERQRVNADLKRGLWMLGTIGTSSPFVGLFGTVVGILQSFQAMAVQGTGGFTVVAAGISEALVATAAGIIVAVVAVLAYNTHQTRVGNLIRKIKLQNEELCELFSLTFVEAPPSTGVES
jgi:biopolymer transport protein ExbB